ncbi:ABC transporter ATP-binding protein [Nocardioides aquaticus]|uniref:ABC transporter ATP-binding protein n=1 Tax=Nocardioides aquaticus TaxID=160826 RepID=UPI0031E04410
MTTSADTGPAPVIDLHGLRQTFSTRAGEVVAVDHLDLRVGVGEVVALLGPNGAGKTTTLDVVLGLTEPGGGTARVLGLPPRQAVQQGRVSAVLQTGGLLADLTVGETLRYVAATYPCPPGRIEEVVERAGLGDLVRRRVSRCSGGEQQRLRFALALLPDPELLVLDEPTAGMDVAARRAFWATMHEEARRGRTVVFATHYLEEADAFAERIVLVARGRVVADGPTHEVRARALGRVVSAAVPDLAAATRRLDGLGEVSADGGRVRVRTGHSDAVALALLTELGGHDLEVAGASLEDAFLQLTADPTVPTVPAVPQEETR